MSLTVITPPTDEPLSVEEARLALRLDEVAEDDFVKRKITAARQYWEPMLNRAFVTQTLEYRIDRFRNEIELPRYPLASVTSVKYIDEDGAEQTLATDVYTVDTTSKPGRIYLAFNKAWPAVRGEPHAVRIRYIAGEAVAAVPEDAKALIELDLAHRYEERSPYVSGTIVTAMPHALRSLYYGLRVKAVPACRRS